MMSPPADSPARVALPPPERPSARRPWWPVGLLLLAFLPLSSPARGPGQGVDLAGLVEEDGWTATPVLSEIYRPGAVLAPSAHGGHDVLVPDCVEQEPTVSAVSASQVGQALQAGVQIGFRAGSAAAHAGIVKRIQFIDPEQRTLGYGQLSPTPACQSALEVAARIRGSIKDAFLVQDVLIATIKDQACTQTDASGAMVALGAAEVTTYSECNIESNVPVPVGFRSIPVDRIVDIGGGPAPRADKGKDRARPDKPQPAPKEKKTRIPRGLAEAVAAERARIEAEWTALDRRAGRSDAGDEVVVALRRFARTYTDHTIEYKRDMWPVKTPEVLLARARAAALHARLNPRFADIFAGFYHTCALRDDGEAVCWGNDPDYKDSPPPKERFKTLSLGDSLSCGLTLEGRVRCWGKVEDYFDPPTGRYAQISVSMNSACVRTEAGAVTCWRNNTPVYKHYYYSRVPQSTYSDVQAGWYHTCAIRKSGRTACWGKNVQGEGRVPSSARLVDLIGAGDFHTAGLDADGRVLAWGPYAVVPSQRFIQAESIDNRVCGITKANKLVCVDGDEGDLKPLPAPPEGDFKKVVVGSRHVCALDVEGRVHCWGEQRWNQLDYPWRP